MAKRKRPSDDLANLDVKNTELTTSAQRAVREGESRAFGESETTQRGPGRPPKGDAVQTTVRLSPDDWAALQRRALEESVRSGRKRYISDVVTDALTAYYAAHPMD